MKILLQFGMTGVAMAIALSLFGVSTVEPEATMTRDALPPGDISMAAADIPYEPARTTPAHVTPAYVAPAYAAPARVVRTRDTQTRAAQAYAATPRATSIHVVPPSVGMARIIHVSQRPDRYAEIDRDNAAAVFERDDEPLPPLRSQSKPRRPFSADEPPPFEPRRTVSSAPPPFDDGPTPVYPTPRFDRKPDKAGDSSPPAN